MKTALMVAASWLGLVGAALAPSAYGATQMEVGVGFARAVAGAMTPIRVHVEHSGLPVEAQLSVSQTVESPWNGVFTETLNTPLHLGQRANKRFTLYFPLNSVVYPLRVQLKAAPGQILAQRTFDFRDQGDAKPLAVALSETAFPHTLPTGETVYPVDAAQLPENVVGFEAIRRLYLGRFDLSTLSDKRQRALLHWLMLGGEVVVFGGENWYVQDSPLLRPWLPLDVPEVTAFVAEDGTETPLLSGNVRGEVAYALEQRPWLLVWPVGRGKLWLSAVDPLDSPPPESFWSSLVPDKKVNEVGLDEVARNAFERQRLFYPARTSLAALLLAFVVGVGVWSWLSSRNAWGTAGSVAWVVAFSVAFVWLFNKPPYAQPLVVTEYGLERALPDGSAFRQTWYGVYAQRREQVTLAFPTAATPRQLLPEQRGEHTFDLTYAVDETTQLQFSAQSHQIRSFVSASSSTPTLRWTLSDGLLSVSSSKALRQVWLWDQGVAYDLGTLVAGQTKQFQLSQAERFALEQRLPSAVVALWNLSTLTQKRATVLGAWRAGRSATLSPNAHYPVYQLIVAEVRP